MTSDDKDELVCLPTFVQYDDACKRYYELFKTQVASGGGSHVIVTPYWPEVASAFIVCVVLTQYTKWKRERENGNGSLNEYIVVIEPTQEAAEESARTFSSAMSRHTLGESRFEFGVVVVHEGSKHHRYADDAGSFSIVCTTIERRHLDTMGYCTYPSFMFCAHPGLLDQPQVKKMGYGSGHCCSFRQSPPLSLPVPVCERGCVPAAPSTDGYARCMCHITTVWMFESDSEKENDDDE